MLQREKDHAAVIVRRMAFLSDTLLDPESGNKLNAARVAHAEDASHLQWNRADVGDGVALRVGADIGQGRAWRLRRHETQCGIESMVGKRARRGNMRGGIGHDNGAKARRIPRGLPDAAGNDRRREQRRFEIDSGGPSAGELVREPGSIKDLESAGERPLQREGEVYIGGIAGVGGK